NNNCSQVANDSNDCCRELTKSKPTFHQRYVEAMSLLSWTVEAQTQLEPPAHLAKLLDSPAQVEVGLQLLFPVRLVGGASRCAGTLEVKRGEWGPVDDYYWTLKASAVAYSVRLVNGTSQCSGRLEVKSNQWWSSVCEVDFDQQDAEVVCRELGCGAPSVLQGALYGEVEAPMWTKEFQCGGHESALLDCRSSDSARATCSPGKAVGLTCSEPVRLVGGASRCAGTLEVKRGEWRPVDDYYWTLKASAVACRDLDCGSAVSTRRGKSLKRPLWRINTDCVHSGFTLRECLSPLDSSVFTLELTCSGKHSHLCAAMSLQATRGQKPVPQETIELDDYSLGVSRAEGGPAEEGGVQAAE
uniref:SRCR domain-containing protein n=1 Tax=Seriola dumerili TaxID=41447 RepID=A0A3B4UQG7_SERDU